MAAMAKLLKCASHGCKATVGIKLCSAPGDDKYRCISCVESLISKHGLENVNDSDDNLNPILHFCNKTCYGVVMRVINSADDLQIPWNKDGNDREDDPNNSMALLIKWITKQGNYEQFCGTKRNSGKKKADICLSITCMINNKGVRKPCTCKQVQSKIEHIEQQFQSAHNWATHTGQGIEQDDLNSFHAADIDIVLTSWKSSLIMPLHNLR